LLNWSFISLWPMNARFGKMTATFRYMTARFC
jgi:hypothetical protein